MKFRYLNAVILLSSTLILTACFNSSSDKKTGATANQASSLANKSADADPGMILDPGALTSDITALFGAADADPVDVKDNDTVQTVIKRLQ
ncbi:hypothetical protein [Leucothrix pacifica]|uniref:Uncharacterized protein n=1 Tax=Leucothrix pacifica TaxID=1247513 RepID=A0A317CCV9_9GAMM|nr:hypothetical protein [Leucothrix pacifica]PWQ96464.1 hypothetical protein DKW60_12965 [Leucothrix pacifica]